MLTLYRCLLRLYPIAYFREYAAEMVSVFCQARDAARRQGLMTLALFCNREIWGVLAGALREKFREYPEWNVLRRIDMRPEFRFPRSTISLMLVILVGVVLTIQKAKTIQVKYGADSSIVPVWSTLPQSLVVMFIAVCAVALAGWAILFALRRSGVHRLANVQTWPEQR